MVDVSERSDWFEDSLDDHDEDEGGAAEYDITASPNDFNIMTIYNYISKGAIKIPGFQRNYVWDIKRASSLIESIVIGLPIPQLFLYETGKNDFLVVDGQQRLMSIYYFIKKRFPKMEARPFLRRKMQESGVIPESIIADDNYFVNFNLSLPAKINGSDNRLNKRNYDTLGDYLFSFEMKTIRNVIIKQNKPDDDDSSIYEIFNRLNASGVTLTAQEIRMSLYHSDFYRMLERINAVPAWRALLGVGEPDIHMKDIEVLLRGFAMLMSGKDYAPSMSRFLNKFSKRCKKLNAEEVSFLESLFLNFVDSLHNAAPDAFKSQSNQRFNISTFDSVMAALCAPSLAAKAILSPEVNSRSLSMLKADAEFQQASQSRTSSKSNVKNRLEKASAYLLPN